MIAQGIAIGIWLFDKAYHRWLEDKPKQPRRTTPSLQIPGTEVGTPIPKIIGRVRVRRPLMVWTGYLNYEDVFVNDATPRAFTTDSDDTPSHRVYALDMLFVVGIPMGESVVRTDWPSGAKLHNVWWGDVKLPSPGTLPVIDGVNTFFGQNVSRPLQYGGPGRGGGLRGAYYWHGGWTDQSFTSPASLIGDRHVDWLAGAGASRVPGLAGQMCVSMVRMIEDGGDPYIDSTYPDTGGSFEAVPYPQHGFIYGEQNSITSMSVEVSSYGDVVAGVTDHRFAMTYPGYDFGGDADPAEAIYCLLTDTLGGLAVDPARLDETSFMAASTTLKAEGHGYSAALDTAKDTGEHIYDILRQTNGVLRDNPQTGLIEYKLIRNDYDPATIPHITRANGRRLENGVAVGWSGLVNQVRVEFENRSTDYGRDSVLEQNNANAVGQSGEVNELVVSYLGIKNVELATQVAQRTLAEHSRPLMKLRAVVDRSFIDSLQGDVVKVSWTKPDISGLIFRIVDVDHGPPCCPDIVLDLVQDYYYVYRGRIPEPPAAIDTGQLGGGIVVGPMG